MNINKLEELDRLCALGTKRALEHFSVLRSAALRLLPESLHGDVPLTVEGLGGLFSASSTGVHITVLRDLQEYFPVHVNFEYRGESWYFKDYSISLGLFGGNVTAKTIEDIVMMSRNLASMKTSSTTQELMSDSFANAAVQ